MTKPPQDNDADNTAVQAGIEKTLSDELEKGLNFAARSLGALDEQERLNLLTEAENAYKTPSTSQNNQLHHQNHPSSNNSNNSAHS